MDNTSDTINNMMAKFHNDLVDINFYVVEQNNGIFKVRSFTANEIRILSAVIRELDEAGSEVVTIPIDKLIKITEMHFGNRKELLGVLRGAKKALLSLSLEADDGTDATGVHIFRMVKVSEYAITCVVEKPCLYMFNHLFEQGNYSKISLGMVNRLNHYQSLLAYQLVRFRYEDKHTLYVNVEKLRRQMNVPKSYDFNGFYQNILKPSIKGLRKYFIGLTMKKIKTGRRVTELAFRYECVNEVGFDEVKRAEFVPFNEVNEEDIVSEKDVPF